MINLRKKRLLTKISIALAIVLTVCVCVSAIFGFLQINDLRNNYYSEISFKAEYLRDDVYGVFASADSVLAGLLSGTPDASVFDVVSEVLCFDSNASATMYSLNATTENLKISDSMFLEILSRVRSAPDGIYRTVVSMDSLIDGGTADAVYLSVKFLGTSYVMATLRMETVFSRIPSYGFENIRVMTDDLTYSCSNVDARLTQTFYSQIDIATREHLIASDAFTGRIRMDGGKYVISITERDDVYSSLRVVPTKNASELDSFTDTVKSRYIIENVFLLLLFSGGFVLLLAMLLKDEGDFQFFNIRNNNYALKINAAGKILWQNNNFAKKFDYHHIGECLSSGGKKTAYLLSTGKPVTLEMDDRDGEKHYLLMSVMRIGKIYRLVGPDLTSEISTYRSLSHADKFDSVTDLQLEWVFINKVSSIVARGKGVKGALALMRLSNLSMLKIMLGEHTYKQLLMIYAGSLKREFEGLGELYVLKNGDFLLFNSDDTGNQLINKIPHIMDRLRLPVKLNDNSIQLDAKLGMIVLNSRDNNITANSLLSNAQRALEYALNSVKQNYYILYPTSFSVSRTNFRADGVVKMMIDNGEIEAYFQPQYSLITDKIVGFEALCRIIGPKSAEINIGELISIAEQYGGMIDLGDYICDKAMAFAAEIQKTGIQIAVNISPIQLMQAGFTNSFVEMFKKHNLGSGVFNIEITEGAALYSFEEAVAKLNIIKNCGVGIHIDDFGVAYSSMLHLKLLPATLVKIDKSLVDDITDSEDARSIIKNIISLAKDLRLSVIAEGVEKKDQMDVLRELRCDMVQGYYISKAVPRLRAIELIKEVNKDGS